MAFAIYLAHAAGFRGPDIFSKLTGEKDNEPTLIHTFRAYEHSFWKSPFDGRHC